jgi:tripartite ATP-independent transporter DctM subunit
VTSVQIGLLGIGALVVLIGLRIPIGIALIGVSFVGTYAIVGDRAAWGMLRAVPYGFTANWALSSVPMFLLMGYVCYHAGLTKGLFEAAKAWLTRLPGGTAVSAVFGAAAFAAVTGSSVACAAAMGRIAVPEMLNQKYEPGLAAGSVAAAGTLGALIPPSILLIVYGIMAQVSIGQLFMGGLAVGLLSVASYVALIVIRVRLNPALAPYGDQTFTWREKFVALGDVWPVLILMLGVMGGLFAGLFTATEAGGCGAALSIIIAYAKGSLNWDVLRRSLVETVITTTSIFIIAMGASLLARFVTLSGISDWLGDIVIAAQFSPIVIILLIVLFYLILGMFLEPIGGMLVTLPIVLPILEPTGYGLLWFGILLAKVLETGMLTPPIGLNVFVIKGVVGDQISLARIFQGVTWFIVADLVVIALCIIFPSLNLYLPELLAP